MTEMADWEIKSQVTERLPCKLSVEELAGLAQSIGKKRREIVLLENEKSQQMDRFKSLIQGAQAQADDYAEQAASGVQPRDVLVHEIHHYRTGEVVRVRPDTNEVLSRRSMTTEERQRSMGFQDPPGAANAAPAGEENAAGGKGPRVHAVRMLPQRAGEEPGSTDIDGQQVLDQLPDEPSSKPRRARKPRGTSPRKRGGK